MLITAVSAMFIKVLGLPNIAGYSPIHILVPVTLDRSSGPSSRSRGVTSHSTAGDKLAVSRLYSHLFRAM